MRSRIFLTLLGLGLYAPSAMASSAGLSEVMQRAIANSPAVRSAQASYDAEAAQTQNARAAFLPQLSVSGNALKLEGSPVAMFGVPGGSGAGGFGGSAGMAFAKPGEAMWLGSATVTQPLFAGFRNLNGLLAAQKQAEAASLDLESARRQAAFDALDALADVQQKHASLKVAEALVKKARSRLDWVEARAIAGSAGSLDRLQSQLQLTRLQQQVEDARRALTIAQEALSDRLGGELGGREALTLAWELPRMTQDEALARARTERLDLRAQALRLEASEMQARGAHAGYLPSVSAFGTTSQLGENSANRGTIVGVQAMWLPFDGLATQAGIRRNEALSAKHRAEGEALFRAVTNEVKLAHAAWEAAASRRDLRRQELALADEAHRLAKNVRAEGALTLSEFTDAEMERAQAKFELEAASLEWRRSELRLVMALGLSPVTLIRQEK